MFLFVPFILLNAFASGLTKEITKIAFGSGFYAPHTSNCSIFEVISSHQPNIFIWLGDSSFIDIPNLSFYWQSTPKTTFTEVEINRIYKAGNKNEHYKELKSDTAIIGTWGQHDYGGLHGNQHYQYKDTSKSYFLQMLNAQKNSDIRYNSGRGVYSSKIYGDNYKTIHVILLDTRYYKTSTFLSVDKNDILGEVQWQWLENEGKTNNATFTLIGSATQILPGNKIMTETWNIGSRKRGGNLIAKYDKNGVIFLSGEIGKAEGSHTHCVLPEIGYELFEITSSGLTMFGYNYTYFEKLIPNPYYIQSYFGINFGEIAFHWGETVDKSNVSLRIYNNDDKLVIERNISYSDGKFDKMRADDKSPFNRDCYSMVTNRFLTFLELIKYYADHRNEFINVGLVGLLVYFFFYLLYKTGTTKLVVIITTNGVLLYVIIMDYINLNVMKSFISNQMD